MNARPVTHPSDETLQALGLGKLTDTAATGTILDHLGTCAQCRAKVAAVLDDGDLRGLRDARQRSDAPIPTRQVSDIARAMEAAQQESTTQPNLFDLPPELRDHPQYDVQCELGRGGMGVVYLARNKLMDRLEVLKVLHKRMLERTGAIDRFLREIRSAARLSHPNVVIAYDAMRLGDLLVFAMEYVPGENLAAVVKNYGGPLPVLNACYYVQQVVLGLQHAYEKGMVHRDIKPHNLILAKQEKKHIVKILDFGLAKARSEGKSEYHLTGFGQMLGTPDYMAPEQWRDAANADIRADIYSLGCTLYFLLAGHVPFKGRSLPEIWQAHESKIAKPLNEMRPDVPPELAVVVAKLMAKGPAHRYQTPIEMAQALLPFLKPTEKGTPAGSGPSRPQSVVVPVAEENIQPKGLLEVIAEPARRDTPIEGGSAIGEASLASFASPTPPLVLEECDHSGNPRWAFWAAIGSVLGLVGLVALIILIGTSSIPEPPGKNPMDNPTDEDRGGDKAPPPSQAKPRVIEEKEDPGNRPRPQKVIEVDDEPESR